MRRPGSASREIPHFSHCGTIQKAVEGQVAFAIGILRCLAGLTIQKDHGGNAPPTDVVLDLGAAAVRVRLEEIAGAIDQVLG